MHFAILIFFKTKADLSHSHEVLLGRGEVEVGSFFFQLMQCKMFIHVQSDIKIILSLGSNLSSFLFPPNHNVDFLSTKL